MHDANQATINPYLNFGGKCEEAMNFYKEVFGGKLEITPFKDSPMKVPDGHENKVMHASLQFEGAIIMASDGMPGKEVVYGDSVTISLSAKDIQQGEAYFKNLSSGGNVLMPFEDQFWGARFGMILDKYGIQWLVHVEQNKE